MLSPFPVVLQREKPKPWKTGVISQYSVSTLDNVSIEMLRKSQCQQVRNTYSLSVARNQRPVLAV